MFKRELTLLSELNALAVDPLALGLRCGAPLFIKLASEVYRLVKLARFLGLRFQSVLVSVRNLKAVELRGWLGVHGGLGSNRVPLVDGISNAALWAIKSRVSAILVRLRLRLLKFELGAEEGVSRTLIDALAAILLYFV
jgi:hypothetical protein